jgi:hypothetical protein
LKIKVFSMILFVFCSFLISCSKNNSDEKTATETESTNIYMQIIQRAEKYNNAKVVVCDELINKVIDRSNLASIKSGIIHFNSEIEKAIDDYNTPDTSYSMKALKLVRKPSKKDIKYRLSKIGFNEALNYAILYEQDNTNQDLGHESFIILHKDGDDWNIESDIMNIN